MSGLRATLTIQSSGRRPLWWRLLPALVGLVALLSGVYALATAEREWPSLPAIDFNLEYGPLPPGAAAEQSLGDMPEPLTKAAVWIDRPASGVRAIVRILQKSGSGQTVLFEQLVDVEPSGEAAMGIPPHVSVVGSDMVIQVVNPADSPVPIYLRGNRVDGYGDGQASINGDPGSGDNDLVLQVWRRSTPRSVLMSMLRTPVVSLLFLAATAAALIIGAGWVSRRAARMAGGALPEAAIAALIIAGSSTWVLFGVFSALEPWPL